MVEDQETIDAISTIFDALLAQARATGLLLQAVNLSVGLPDEVRTTILQGPIDALKTSKHQGLATPLRKEWETILAQQKSD